MENINIVNNQGNRHYESPHLTRNDRFLLFAYKIRPEKEEQSRLDVSVSQSRLEGVDELRLDCNGRDVSFLLTPHLEQNIDYFQRAYLPFLPDTPLHREQYKVEKISLLSHGVEGDEYGVTIGLEGIRESETPRGYWIRVIEETYFFDLVPLWQGLNSFYRQLRDKNQLPQPALTYLAVTQEDIANAGSNHLDCTGCVMTSERYLINPDLFEVRDRSLESRTVTPRIYVEDLKQAVFFNPALHRRLLNASASGNKLKVRARTDNLLDLKIR